MTEPIDFRESRAAWFVELERARERGQADRADQARGQLRRLGCEVRYYEAMERKAVTIREAAELLSISESLVRSCVYRGELASARLGGRILIPMHAIDDLLAQGGRK